MKPDLEKWVKELRKGNTKLAILSLLTNRDMYGYEVTQKINELTDNVFSLKESNTYPALHTMEGDGLIKSYWKDAGPGLPPRKYYAITDDGREFLESMKSEWEKHNEAMNRIWGYKEGPR